MSAAFRIAALICLASSLPLAAASAPPVPAYNWKQGDVLRFEYSKTVSIAEPSAGKDPGNRAFKFDGILIIEIKSKLAAGATAVLRFDSPHLNLPESYWYSSQNDDDQLQKDKDKTVEHAIEGAISHVRWNVFLDNNGGIRIDSRYPRTVEEWLNVVENAAQWRKKFRANWIDLVEKNLGFVPSGEEHDLLLSLTSAPVPPAPPPPAAAASVPASIPPPAGPPESDKIRPFRAVPKQLALKENRAEFSFLRAAPPNAGTAYVIPNVGPPAVEMQLRPAVETQNGSAVFDVPLGLLDSLNEDYSFKLDYRCRADQKTLYSLAQDVNVKYSLKRLAPPLSKYDQAIEVLPAISR